MPHAFPEGQIVEQPELQQFFAEIDSRLEQTRTAQRQTKVIEQPELQQFFEDISYRLELAQTTQRRIDQKLATRFNIFNLIEPDENKLSDILAGLLDPNGDHGQGDLFLRLLFEKLELRLTHTKVAMVQREAPTTHNVLKNHRRIDVLVEAGALIAIENKVDSLEQPDQIKDYLEHLIQCARNQAVPYALIYLTPNGRQPTSLQKETVEKHRELHCWSYQNELYDWLEQCRRACEAEKIRYFIADFLSYIETSLKREPEIETETKADEH